MLAISSELFLKFLLVENGKSYPHIHKIKELFDKLDEKTKNDVKLDFDLMLKCHKPHTDYLTKITYKNKILETSNSNFIIDDSKIFETMLNQVDNSFTEWRYVFEKNNLEIDLLYFSIFAECLNREADYVFEHKYPEFK